jgi:hypothetical protein
MAFTMMNLFLRNISHSFTKYFRTIIDSEICATARQINVPLRFMRANSAS